jgi:hypothetical protein
MRATVITAAAIAATVGCGSLGSTTAAAGGAPSSAPSSVPSSAPSAEASSTPCTTKACIVEDANGLVGTVAKDESVLTKLSCKKSTVKQPTPGVYTVHCTATYSDGSVYAGIASVLITQGKVTWEATSAIDYGSGG